MNRQFFHYQDLEEFKQGMWRIVRGRKRIENATAAADLMRDSSRFLSAMRKAVSEWPNSVAHNLTADGVNKIAWLGHAGCCVGCGSPEENTRIGWHMLTQSEQDEANRVAGIVLSDWLDTNSQDMQLELFGGFGC